MLLIEMLLILEGNKIPVFLLPSNTSHDVISWMHKLFPAYMNGCRCIIGAFTVDRKGYRVEALRSLLEHGHTSIEKIESIAQHFSSLVSSKTGTKYGHSSGSSGGTVVAALLAVRERCQTSAAAQKVVADSIESIGKAKRIESPGKTVTITWLRNLALFLISRAAFKLTR